MADPILSAKRSSFEVFLQTYDPKTMPRYIASTGQTALMGAVANRDPEARVAIANRLLDDGADASAVTSAGTTNVLHILFDHRKGLTSDDAKLLKRLLDGGANVNLPGDRNDVPLAVLYNNYTVPDETSGPLYDVLFARPDLDLDGPASTQITFRQLLDVYPDSKPDFNSGPVHTHHKSPTSRIR